MSGDEEMPLIHSCVVGSSGVVLLFFVDSLGFHDQFLRSHYQPCRVTFLKITEILGLNKC